jgi:plastocyanin
MRFTGLTFVASVSFLVACGGGEPKPAANGPAAAQPTTATSTASYKAPTGKIWEVKMSGAGDSFKFEPASLTIKAGDGIKFIAVTGFPHNVGMLADSVPADVRAQMSANMPTQESEMTGPMLTEAGASYMISFTDIKPGKYTVHCTPHLMYNMKAEIIVQ